MTEKLFSSEIRIMELLWENGEMSAKELAAALLKSVGWSKTTTYTVIKNALKKARCFAPNRALYVKPPFQKTKFRNQRPSILLIVFLAVHRIFWFLRLSEAEK